MFTSSTQLIYMSIFSQHLRYLRLMCRFSSYTPHIKHVVIDRTERTAIAIMQTGITISTILSSIIYHPVPFNKSTSLASRTPASIQPARDRTMLSLLNLSSTVLTLN
jgi:hypothetical protein